MPTVSNIPDVAQQTTFVAYLHYLEDLAGVVGGRYGMSGGLVEGIYQGGPSAPPARRAPPPSAVLRRLSAELDTAWRHLVRLEELAAPGAYDRQANAVLPGVAFAAVVAAVRALAAADQEELDPDPRDALDYAAGRISEGLLPAPWSSRCLGCPQVGTSSFEQVVPGSVGVLAPPDPATSDARLALLLRTTRMRVLDEAFAEARRRDVRPGRCRRNLSAQEKESIAASTGPTTLLDVFARLGARADRDGGDAFVDGAGSEVAAFRFAEALRTVTDATVAALEAAVASLVGFDLLSELLDSALRRTAGGPVVLRRRAAAAGARARSAAAGERAH